MEQNVSSTKAKGLSAPSQDFSQTSKKKNKKNNN